MLENYFTCGMMVEYLQKKLYFRWMRPDHIDENWQFRALASFCPVQIIQVIFLERETYEIY